MTDPKAIAEYKAHPDYADGYGDAFTGRFFDTDRAGSEPYAYGYAAGERAVELFNKNGFQRSGGGFAIKLSGRQDQ